MLLLELLDLGALIALELPDLAPLAVALLALELLLELLDLGLVAVALLALELLDLQLLAVDRNL